MILIVDDSAAIRRVTKSSLELMGLLVDEAYDAENALEKLHSKVRAPYQLIITDYNMPGMNGVQLTSKIRELEQYKSTPMMLLTTEDGESIIESAQKVGINRCLRKPYKFDNFSDSVKELLSNKYLNSF